MSCDTDLIQDEITKIVREIEHVYEAQCAHNTSAEQAFKNIMSELHLIRVALRQLIGDIGE